VLYGGFIVTDAGIRVIEFNARFGDPEALNVLPILRGDFVEICRRAATGTLRDIDASFEHKATVCKYVVPNKYPWAKELDAEIQVRPPTSDDHVRVYWAAVNQEQDSGTIRLTGSRALAFVGIGNSLSEAEAYAEEAALSVVGPVRHRSDIGTEKLIQRRIDHMNRLRGHDANLGV
jgi:phosphoribosylamine-glycine ligase